MDSFKIAFINVLISLLYMAPGFILCKTKKAVASHLSTISAILIYACSPCMIISSFISLDYSLENLWNMALFFVVSFIIQLTFLLIVFLIFRKKFHISKYRMLTIGSVLGNCGFFGLPLIKALLPNNPEVACYSSIYVISMNILVFTAGIYCLTQDKKYISVKAALVNPTALSFVVAFPLYLLGASNWLPTVLKDSIGLLGKMTTPMCMFILGIRLATMDFKKLFTNSFVYFACIGKLIVFPLFAYACVFFLPLPAPFKASMLILAATPCASIILNLAEMQGKEQEMSANCILLSTLLCILTIPVLALLI
ncbi:MAG: AEC family transporter [Lachnospiraceae bacterium]|nr:AEC family transporter [Lachnospiraceae bacterium]